MADLNGTDARERINGTTENDVIHMFAGNDTVYASTGNDLVYGDDGWDVLVGEYGNDTLYGGEGNDTFYGGGLDDLIFGEAGNDGMLGDSGNDTLVGGMGNDTAFGSIGNDTFVHAVGEGIDTLHGEAGSDTLELYLTTAQLTPALRADLQALKDFMVAELSAAGTTTALSAQAKGSALTLTSVGVVMDTIENVRVILDGNEVSLDSLLNQAPEVAPLVAATVAEDVAYNGVVEATDVDGDALTFAVVGAPGNGAVAIDETTGAYTYTPAANWSGVDSFRVAVTDSFGHVVEQEVQLTVEAVADAPELTVISPVVATPGENIIGNASDNFLMGGAGGDLIDGGDGNDVLVGSGSSHIEVPLDVATVLGDVDGSENITITIAGLPAGAMLSAGVDNGDGSWALEPGMLAGLVLTADVDAGFSLTVTAVSTEANGSSSSVTRDIQVDLAEAGNTIVGGSGNDEVVGGAGADVIHGGGTSIAPKDTSAPEAFSAFAAVAKVAKAPVADDDIVHAGDGGDVVYGNAGNDELHGEAGNDWISGGKGDDVLFGGDDNDDLNGNSGDDVLYDGAGTDVVNGSSGNDVVVAGEGDDVYKGGSGFDTLDFSEATGSMMIDVSKKTAVGMGTDTFSGFETYIGSGFADTMKGSSHANAMDGGAGSDVLRGMAGADTLTGCQGNDTFQWLAKDVVSGGVHQGVDVVTDFTEGDKIDLHDMLKKFKGNVEDHVRLTESDQGSMLSVEIGGTFHDVALLEGIYGTSAADLLASGSILA